MPFIFLDSTEDENRLLAIMSGCGFTNLNVTRSSSGYEPTTLQFTCPWLPGSSVKILIFTRWWDDGQATEDSLIELTLDGDAVLTIDVSDLLTRKLSLPLRTHINEEIAASASVISGKRRSSDE